MIDALILININHYRHTPTQHAYHRCLLREFTCLSSARSGEWTCRWMHLRLDSVSLSASSVAQHWLLIRVFKDRLSWHVIETPFTGPATLRLWIAGLWLCVPVYWVALVFLACKDTQFLGHAHVNTGSYTGVRFESEPHLRPRESRSRHVQLTVPVKCYIQLTANGQLTKARHRRHAWTIEDASSRDKSWGICCNNEPTRYA